ncbi:MAG TPA: hypothetical protein VFT87_05750 [Candidatus Saccharimonadales bacterium]|nr:hypothetical protein [Candidatus Saccharimonadales bacterium]
MSFFVYLVNPYGFVPWLLPFIAAVGCGIAAFKAYKTARTIDTISYGVAVVTLFMVGYANSGLADSGFKGSGAAEIVTLFGGMLLTGLGVKQFTYKQPKTWFWPLVLIGCGLVLIGCGLWLEPYNLVLLDLRNFTDKDALLAMNLGLWILVPALVVRGTIKLFKKLAAKVRDLKNSKKNSKAPANKD